MKRFTLLFVLIAAVCITPTIFAQGASCEVPDDGSGTVTMPPEGCGYVSPDDFHVIVDGLPPGTVVIVKPTHGWFVCEGNRRGLAQEEKGCVIGGTPETGETEQFDSIVQLEMRGQGGALDGYHRVIDVPALVTTSVGPRTPGDAVQSFATQMDSIQGSIAGDPDFAFLKIEGGRASGLDSPGHTTLTYNPNTKSWNVESEFQVGYAITFEGAPGSILEGAGGTTKGYAKMSATAGPDADTVPTSDSDR